jgi:hypothetical protein
MQGTHDGQWAYQAQPSLLSYTPQPTLQQPVSAAQLGQQYRAQRTPVSAPFQLLTLVNPHFAQSLRYVPKECTRCLRDMVLLGSSLQL